MPQPPLIAPNPALGRYAGAVQIGSLFSGGNQAVVATAFTAGLTTAYTGGLILYNPLTSTASNLLVQNVTASFILAQTNASLIGLGVGYSGTTAPSGTLTVVPSQNGNLNSSATPQGVLYSSATITLPSAMYLARHIGTVNTGAETTEVDSFVMFANIDGAISIPPGGYAAFVSSAAGTASSFFGNISWVEI